MTKKKSQEFSLRDRVVWVPLVQGGANLTVLKLKTITARRIAFGKNPLLAMVGYTLLSSGVLGLLSGIVQMQISKQGGVFMLVWGGVFSLLSMGILRRLNARRPVFDKDAGYFWDERREPEAVGGNAALLRRALPLERIAALQLLGEHKPLPGEKPFGSCELNLVLDDASRWNLLEHGSYREVLTAGKALSAFLNVPLWQEGE
ncbi:MAG: hypothetical protein J6R85_01105 [Lentisphaeria bacterium]|nr:hypothetical protein [Lentisphaeria bacterium]